MGPEIFRGHQQFSRDWKEAICQLLEPHTMREMQAFLGMVGWCHSWIPSYGLLEGPLYGVLKAAEKGIVVWIDNTRAAFKQLKHFLMSAPALGLPDLNKPFEVFTYEGLNVALRVLSRFLGNQQMAMAYFSEQLDSVCQVWPGCL